MIKLELGEATIGKAIDMSGGAACWLVLSHRSVLAKCNTEAEATATCDALNDVTRMLSNTGHAVEIAPTSTVVADSFAKDAEIEQLRARLAEAEAGLVDVEAELAELTELAETEPETEPEEPAAEPA
jgi:hypothetical protein